MDFGCLDGLLLCSNNNNKNNNNTNSNTLISGYYDLDPKSYVGFKHERSLSSHNTQDLKVAKTTQDCFSKTMLQQQQQTQRSNSGSAAVFSDSQNMLSFSSPNNTQQQQQQSSTFPYYARNNNTGNGIRGVITGVRGPFTPSQWMELEHQALIYKYITVNAPIPSNLLIPIRKALESATFSSYPRHSTYGWGGFHFGFSNNSDPEPGRCRRTDGKKWRCSRDAVADQKYCERHMNRGRHRSRKPVESVNGPTTTTAAAKVSASASVISNNSTGISHLLQQTHHQLANKMQPGATPNLAAYSQDSRSFLNKGNMMPEKLKDVTSNSMLPPSTVNLKQNPLSEFGLVCSDSLLNPLIKTENGVQKSQNSLHQFMDDWPHSDKTQLSIAIPIASSDFMSSNSPQVSERLNFSPLKMGLGVGNATNSNVFDERSQQGNWIPVSWETSMGGPLGEVLNHSSASSPSALNLMTDGYENSQQMTLSPTGVLQKTAFGCFSNSSAGSSPRTDNSLLGSTLITSSLPLL
uniref:growth-regulating factor 6-like n=1 Tax=Erigeron canadensis TaxID=72917 RepID=UPI001CB9A116|nr:growth-regulating factor 6-like [Erigeron canadensis]